MDYTNEQLEEMVVGKRARPVAVFYEKAMLDTEASKKAGKRVYVNTVYVKMRQPGVTDSISYKARKQDIAEYPDEYAHFQRTRQGANTSVSINIIPNLEMAHMQELLDMGLTTVDQLAAADLVPPHLEYARKSAKTLNQVLQEQKNGNEEEGIEEGREAHEVLAADRQQHADGVGQPRLPTREGVENDEATEGLRESRRQHNRQNGLSYNDWEVNFRFTA